MAEPDITYRWVDGPDSQAPRPATEEEWSAICAIIDEQGWTALNRVLTRVHIAEDTDGKIVAINVFQMLPSCGPMYVDKSLRGTGIAESMADEMGEFLRRAQCRWWMVVADSAHTSRLALRIGMKPLASPVYVGRRTE